MSIAIQSSDELEQLRERLRKMPDSELIRFGKAARRLCRDPKCPDTFRLQLEEARGEGRRRHTRKRRTRSDWQYHFRTLKGSSRPQCFSRPPALHDRERTTSSGESGLRRPAVSGESRVSLNDIAAENIDMKLLHFDYDDLAIAMLR